MTADQFRATIERLGLSGYDAARALEISRRQISNYLNGTSDVPRTVELALIGLDCQSHHTSHKRR